MFSKSKFLELFFFSIMMLFFTPEIRCNEVIWSVVNNGFLSPHTYVGLSTMPYDLT